MDLYLVRHGKAEPGGADAERRLTEAGRKSVRRLAAWAAELELQVDQIHHSGRARAVETAEILAAALAPRELCAFEGLDPESDVRLAAEFLLGEQRSVMLVGHLPHLARLASLLLTGAAEPAVVRFRKASIVCLSHEGSRWRLEWAVAPRLIGA